MVAPMTGLAIDVAMFTAAALTLLILLRIVFVLSANPIGEFSTELVYLRAAQLRTPGVLLLVVILLEFLEYALPFLVRQGWLRPLEDVLLWSNLAQAMIVLIASILVVLVVSRYTHRALDRRIRESMETLAYLEGQRRRRRSVERGEWERREDE